MRALWLASVFAAVVGCSASSNTLDKSFANAGGDDQGTAGAGASGQGPTTSAGAGGQGGSGLGLGVGGGASGAGGSSIGGCSAAAELVYVFSTDNDIWSFDPPTKQFTKIATPDCPQGQPNSMAIDRNLVAWLNYIGFIYTFDLKKKSGCQLALTPPNAFTQVGMGFSTDAVGGTAETLYVDGIGGGGLAKIVNDILSPIGKFASDPNLAGQSAELTGTGDARLYGYFTTFPYVRVAQIDKASGNILSDHEITGVAPPSDWAFTFWGGDFYLYAAPGNNNTGNSSVIHYNPTTNAVDTSYVADVGFQIIGAGVSTCAPLKPPS